MDCVAGIQTPTGETMRHYNPSIHERAARIFNTKQGDTISEEVISNIQPTIEITPKLLSIHGTASNSTSTTLITTPADKDFYIVATQLCVIKDVTSTSTLTAINATIDGVSRRISIISGLTLTVQDQTIAVSYGNKSLKIDRNTSITVTNSTATANVIGSATITYYTEEVTK